MSAYHSLYTADTELVLQYVREIDEGVSSALLVGHNPTAFDVAWRLLAESDDPDDPAADRKILEAHGFPICALAVLVLELMQRFPAVADSKLQLMAAFDFGEVLIDVEIVRIGNVRVAATVIGNRGRS